MSFSKVLFPQPLSPIIAKFFPLSREKETDSIVRLSEYENEILFTVSIDLFEVTNLNILKSNKKYISPKHLC
jgi:hypothetical protein